MAERNLGISEPMLACVPERRRRSLMARFQQTWRRIAGHGINLLQLFLIRDGNGRQRLADTTQPSL